jgi:site-specific DNA recombinase
MFYGFAGPSPAKPSSFNDGGNQMTTRAALYLRVSTEDQAAEGYSIASQKERLEAFCKSQGWEIYDYFIDDGYSGKNLDRPAVRRLIEEARQKKFNVVLVYRLDRFSRRAVDLLRVVEEVFEPAQVCLKSVTEPFDTGTIAGRLMLSMLVAFAQFERESIAERVKVNMLHKARSGEWCGAYQAPYGYMNEDKRLVIVPHEAAVIKQMFNLYARGTGMRAIAKHLNSSGIRTRKGNEWSNITVRQILTNPEYAGYMVYNRTQRKGTRTIRRPREEWVIVEGKHEPIIDRELFWKVQDMIEKKSVMHMREVASQYPLSGLVYCGICGSRYRGWFRKAKKPGRIVKYYRCIGREHGFSCRNSAIQAERLEGMVLDVLEEYSRDSSLYWEAYRNVREEIEQGASMAAYLEEARKALAEVDRRKQKWFDLYEQGGIGFPDFRERLDQLNREKEEKMRQIEELEASLARLETKEMTLKQVAEAIKNVRSLWEAADVQERKMLIRSIVKRIVIYPGNVEVQLLD